MQANPKLDRLRMMLAVTIGQASLGPKIRRARKAKRWKQKHLAAAVHVEPITVSRWERGVSKPDLDTLEVVAEALDKPVSYFVTPDEGAAELALDEIRQELAVEVERMRDLNDQMEARLAETRRDRRPA